MARFPEDHPVVVLRGLHVPGDGRARRSLWLLRRWLEQLVVDRQASEEPVDLLLDELAAVVVALERMGRVEKPVVEPKEKTLP